MKTKWVWPRASNDAPPRQRQQQVTARAGGLVQQIKNEEADVNALLVLLAPRVDEKPVVPRRSELDAPEQSGGGGGTGAKKPSLMTSLLKTYSGSLAQAQQGQEPPAKRPALNPTRRSV